MLKKSLFTIIILYCISCNSQDDCTNLNNIFKAVLKNEKVGMFLHTELQSRKNLLLKKNEIINCDVNFRLEELNVKTSEYIPLDNNNYIEIKKLTILKESASIVFFYPIENIEVEVHLLKNDNWHVNNYEIIEF